MKKRWIASVLIMIMTLTSFGGCGINGHPVKDEAKNALEAMALINTFEENIIEDNYRNCYEIFPYSFCDSNGDGIGDIQGIISKLDYIKDLGINSIWLTPVHQSPTYHKYDVVDYYSIDSQFGTVEDYEQFLKEAHNREITVLMDLVVNHTSSSHPWFYQATQYLRTLEAGEEPSVEECPYVEYYVFTKEYKAGFEKVSGTDYYYECRFWSGMPDLNLDSEVVRAEIAQIVKFWIDKGVDGFRLDAVTSYYTGNNEKNIEFLSWLNTTVKSMKPDAYLVGECWENSTTYAKYYASGVDSFFNYDFGAQQGVIAATLRGGSALSFGNKIVVVDELMKEQNPNYISAPFTNNHDNGRIASSVPGDINKLKMGQAMAMMMGGTYYLYYGDEVGMKGSGDDENKRAPMQWSVDAKADGMCKSVATKTIEMSNGSVESQAEDPDSLLNYVKQGLKIRNTFPEIARGTNEVIVECSTEDVLVLKKTYNGSELLIVMNISEEQSVVDLSNICINGKEAGNLEVCGTLLVSVDMVIVEGSTLTMPAYSVEILR